VDGERKVVSTESKVVGDVLRRAGIVVGPQDLVEPGQDTVFNTQVYNINVYRAKPVVVVDAGREYRVNSPYGNPKLIAEKSAGIKVYPEDRYNSELIQNIIEQGSLGSRITVDRATPFVLKVDGQTLDVRTQAETARAAVEDKGVVLGAEDRLNVPAETPVTPGMEIVVTRIGQHVTPIEEVIPAPTEVIYDNSQSVGWEQVKREGTDGKQLVTYEIHYQDSQIVEKKALQTVVLTPAVARIVIRGNKPVYSPLADAFARLRICESGGNYAANTGNGYYGAYQFSISTWQSMGTGFSRPDQAPPAVQDDAAQRLQARAGWGQWPSCARKLGLY